MSQPPPPGIDSISCRDHVSFKKHSSLHLFPVNTPAPDTLRRYSLSAAPPFLSVSQEEIFFASEDLPLFHLTIVDFLLLLVVFFSLLQFVHIKRLFI